MVKTMNYVNLSDLAAELNLEKKTDFTFFWATEDNSGVFLYCNDEKLQDLIEYVEYLESQNCNHRYLQKTRNEINAMNLLRTKYGITDRIFVLFD